MDIELAKIKRLDAIVAKLDALLVAVNLIGELTIKNWPSQELKSQPTARLSLPERCLHVEASRCGLQDPDARYSMASFVDPNGWQCRGCRVRETVGAGTTGE